MRELGRRVWQAVKTYRVYQVAVPIFGLGLLALLVDVHWLKLWEVAREFALHMRETSG